MKKKQGLLSKAVDILEANIKPLPVNEDWYKERMKICNACEYNTANGAKHVETLSSIIDSKACGVGSCTACGCCTDKKASLKRSVCGLSEPKDSFLEKHNLSIPLTPKWTEVEVEVTSVKNGIKVSYEGDKSKTFLTKNSKLEPELHVDTTEEVVNLFVNLEGVVVKSVTPSCTCTVPIVKEISNELYEINLRISTKGFDNNKVTTRYVEVEYYRTPSKVETMNIYLKIYKTNG